MRAALVVLHRWFGLFIAVFLFVSGQSGAIVGILLPGSGSAGDIFMQAQFPPHTGRILVSLLGLAVAMLSVTGVVIWLKKRRSRVRGEQRSRLTLAEVPGTTC